MSSTLFILSKKEVVDTVGDPVTGRDTDGDTLQEPAGGNS